MIVFWHRGGPGACNGPAVGLRAPAPNRYEIPAELALKLDGSTPARGEPMVCGTCGRGVHPQWLRAE
jgi:hypothetical protein